MEKIDFVIPWVDGADKNWLNERNQYSGNTYTDTGEARFRDWETLKYWFRGVEKFAPWVNKIYFVTWGHIPEWLDTGNKKLVVVNHKDYIPKEYLPTFNSHVIELNLFRIKELSEKFVYFNDDTFIINKVLPTDFFVRGLPCDSAVLNPFIPSHYNDINFVGNNNISIINKNFRFNDVIKNNARKYFNIKYGLHIVRTFLNLPYRKFAGFKEFHFPNSFLKSTFQEIWEKEYDILDLTSKSRFRNNKTNVNQWLVREWQFAKGTFYPRNPNIGVYFDLSGDNEEQIVRTLLCSRKKIICLNDTEDVKKFEENKKNLICLFEKKFPDKSSFEK